MAPSAEIELTPPNPASADRVRGVRQRITRDSAAIVICLSLFFHYLCCRPIWHTDVWGHLAYGRLIWNTGSIPTTEPLLPLSKGMPFVDSAWLSQLIGLAVVSCPRLGIAGLQGLFASLLICCAALLWRRAYRETSSLRFGMLAPVVFLVIGWQPLLVLRPQLAGLVCFTSVLTRMTSRRLRRTDWLVVPIIFALWANLHASFVVGLGLLVCLLVGQFCDVLVRTRSFRAACRGRKVPRLLGLICVSAVAVLANPYGLLLYREVLQFSASPNLRDLTEWQPLNIRDEQGLVFSVAVVCLLVVFRVTPRRIRTWELLALFGLGFATLWSSRMIVWWATVAGLLVAVHSHAIWRGLCRGPVHRNGLLRSTGWSFAALTTAVIAISYSPIGLAVLTGQQPDSRKALSEQTPLFAAEYLAEHRPPGLVFNTYEWGDYLLWAGPPDLQLLVNSHAHLIPRDVWRAYMQVTELRSGWEKVLDDYGIQTIVLDRLHRDALIQALSMDRRWQHPPLEKDGQVIFIRR